MKRVGPNDNPITFIIRLVEMPVVFLHLLRWPDWYARIFHSIHRY